MYKVQSKNLKWHNVVDELPDVVGSWVSVYIETANERRPKGAFYYNGGKPEFVSYGSEMLDVVRWAYTGGR